MENLSRQHKDLEREYELRRQDIENYKRVVNENEEIIQDLSSKLSNGDERVYALTAEL